MHLPWYGWTYKLFTNCIFLNLIASIVFFYFYMQLIVIPDAKMVELVQDLEHVAAGVTGLEADVNQVKRVNSFL